MKTSANSLLIRISLAVAAACGLSSCVTTDYYSGSYYGGGYYDRSPSYGYSSYSPSYYHGSSYSRCSRCGYNPCRCSSHSSHSGHDHDDHDDHDDHKEGSRSDSKIRLLGTGSDGPKGYHNKEWYEKRGYDVDDHKHVHRDGTVHKGDDDDKKKKNR
jgi:hypothetical protein